MSDVRTDRDVKTYRRPMGRWWTRNPVYRRYMAREVSSFFLFGYALTLLYGLWRLSQGPVAYEAWRAWLSSPVAIAWHLVVLVFAVIHATTWFEVAPKTMPKTGLPEQAITRGGFAAAALASLIVVALAAWWGASS